MSRSPEATLLSRNTAPHRYPATVPLHPYAAPGAANKGPLTEARTPA